MLLLLVGCFLGFLETPSLQIFPGPDLHQPVTVVDAAGGVCVSVQLDRWDAGHRAVMVDALGSMGVRTLRHDLLWSYVESSRGVWDWTSEDAWMESAEDAGFDVIAMMAYGNAWASSDPNADEYYPPDDPADFATFAAETAARYGDRLHRYEIWNEPNAGYRFWKVGDPPALSGDPAGYAALFVPAADAIHAAAPDAEVQIGGTFYLDMGIIGGPEFVTEAASKCCPNPEPRFLEVADGLAYHPYTTYPPRVGPEESDDFEVPIWDMHTEMRASAVNTLPLSATEAGWPSWGDVDEDTQAAFLVRGFALAQADGVRDYCVYTLEDWDDPENPEANFGLYRPNSSERKPAGEALATLASNIAGMDCHGRAEWPLGLPDGVFAVRWAGPEGSATAIWTTSGEQGVTMPASEGACEGDQTVIAGTTPVWVLETLCEHN